MAFDNAHNQPGRRFAKGATWDDIVLGSFGFVAHMLLFCFLGGLLVLLAPRDVAICFLVFCAMVASVLLFIRAAQVKATTTKESIAAIKKAFQER